MTLLQQVGADHRLGGIQIAVHEQPRRDHHLARELAERGHVTGRHGGVGGLPGHAIKAFEHRPARGQRVIDVDGEQERGDRLRCALQGHVAVTALLVEAAEARMVSLQRSERVEGIGDATQIPLGDGHEQQRIPLARRLGQQGFARRQRLGKIAPPDQPADAGHFGGAWRCNCIDGVHGSVQKKGGLGESALDSTATGARRLPAAQCLPIRT